MAVGISGESVSRRRHRRGAVAKTVGFSIWTALVAIVLVWQSADYFGIMSLIGEWQFNALGRHFPTFNYVLLTFLLCLPGYLLFLKPRERAETERAGAATLRSARVMLKALIGAAAGLGIGALVTFVLLLLLPGESGERQQIDLARPSLTLPREGPVRIAGDVLYDRTAGFDDDLLLVRRTYRFAPIVGAGQDKTRLRYFIQLRPVNDQTRGGAGPLVGVLKRNGLPGEVVRLFSYAGFTLDDPHFVLYTEPAAMRWPYLVGMMQFAIGAILALLAGLFQRRRVGRLDRQIHESADG